MQNQQTPRKYFYRNRPPGIGCQPEGFTETQAWVPMQHPDQFPRGAFGYVIYSTPLPVNQVWRYDLFPADPLEKALYMAWQDEEQNLLGAVDILRSYFSLGPDALELAVSADDFTAIDVQAAINAGYVFDDLSGLLASQGSDQFIQEGNRLIRRV